VYLTIDSIHQIFICNKENGQVNTTWGTIKEGNKPGEFCYPLGVTIDSKYSYICDYGNHRIQILLKEDGNFVKQWGTGKDSMEMGSVSFPYSIYEDLEDEIFYIGDCCSVQLFRKQDDVCVQRIGVSLFGDKVNGHFQGVHGIGIMNNRLYVTDYDGFRIQIFKLKGGEDEKSTKESEKQPLLVKSTKESEQQLLPVPKKKSFFSRFFP